MLAGDLFPCFVLWSLYSLNQLHISLAHWSEFSRVFPVYTIVYMCTVFIRIKAGLKYTQVLKYTLGSAAEWKK